jgi:hypothetical protein
MVHNNITWTPIVDTLAILIPIVPCYRHDSWTIGECGKKRKSTVRRQLDEALHLDSTRNIFRTTLGVHPLVVIITCHTIALGILKGQLGCRSQAASITTTLLRVGNAIDKMLPRQHSRVPSGELQTHFQRTSSCHSPARSTIALVPNIPG